MRFDRREPPRSKTPLRKSRSRVTGLFIALVLVIMAIQLAADPQTWSWLFPPPQDQQRAQLDAEEISYDVTLSEGDSLAPDEFRAEPNPVPSESPPGDPALLQGINLAVIEDNTLGLRPDEHEIQQTLLGRLRDLPANTLSGLAETTPTFRAVMLEPDHYRGRVFEIRGRAKRILELPAEPGAPPRYELWVFTRDSGINPWRVVSAEIPKALPTGLFEEEGVPVRITGLFFKRQGYETHRHELHVAPLLLAKTVNYRPSRSQPAAPENAIPWILGAIILGGIAVAIFLWRAKRSDSRFEQRVLQRYQTPDDDPAAPASDPASFLKQLAAKPDEPPK